MNKTLKFWIQVVIFSLFACIIPLAFIIWRFDLFKVVNKTTFGVWGVLCLIIAFAFIIVVSKYITKGMPYSFGTQILNGVLKVVLPCVIVLFASYKLKDEMDLFVQVMGVICISEAVAIVINPFPKWIHDNRKNEAQDMIDVLLDRKDGKTKSK